MTARAALAVWRQLEEIALELGAAVLHMAGQARRKSPPRDPARIARVLRYLESRTDGPQTLAALARIAGLSRYHFVRTFRDVTGVTPHQRLLRARSTSASRISPTSSVPSEPSSSCRGATASAREALLGIPRVTDVAAGEHHGRARCCLPGGKLVKGKATTRSVSTAHAMRTGKLERSRPRWSTAMRPGDRGGRHRIGPCRVPALARSIAL
jgi:hypothetical protein